MSTARADIQVVAENQLGGHDLLITDVHGTASRLRRLLEHRLGSKNRLFIAGDLLDKGPDSFGVIKLLQDERYKGRIHIVRGNHEQLCLDAIKALEFFATTYSSSNVTEMASDVRGVVQMIASISKPGDKEKVAENLLGRALDLSQDFDRRAWKAISDLHLHLINASTWMIDTFLLELTANRISVAERTGEDKVTRKGIHYKKTSEILNLREFIDKLPVIILKSGRHPFVMVHADMPITDKELFTRINSNQLNLPPDKIYYAIWARKDDLDMAIKIIRDANSMLAAVGHSPTIIPGISAVRKESNTVDGDIAAFIIDNYLVLNMTTGQAEYFKPTTDALLLKILGEVNAHLQAQIQRNLVVRSVPKAAGAGYQLILMKDRQEAKAAATSAPELKVPTRLSQSGKLKLEPLGSKKNEVKAPEKVAKETRPYRVAPLESKSAPSKGLPNSNNVIFGKKGAIQPTDKPGAVPGVLGKIKVGWKS